MFGLGMGEVVVILLIVLILFGGSRLPGLAAGLGGAVHQFRKALRGDEDDKALPGRSGDATAVDRKSETSTKT